MNLIEALENENSDELLKRIKLLEPASKNCPSRKADRIAYLRNFLLSTKLDFLVEQMSVQEKIMVAEVVYNQSGNVDEDRLLARYGYIPKGYTQDQYHYGYSPYNKPDQTRVKSQLKLIFYQKCIPSELGERLKELLPVPKMDSVKVTAKEELDEIIKQKIADSRPEITIRCMEMAAHQDLYSVLRLIDQEQIRVSEKTHIATAASMKKITAELYEGDFFNEQDEDLDDYYKDKLSPVRAFSWPLLLQSAGLARRTGNKLKLSTKGKNVLQHKTAFADAILDIYNFWRDKGKIDEFSRINRIKGQTRRGRGSSGSQMTPPSHRRMELNIQFQSCPVGEWVQIDEWFRFMQSSEHQFEITHNPWALYLVDSHYGSLGYSNSHEFSILQGRYAMVYLLEYLATLGMVDVAYSTPQYARFDFSENWGADELDYLSRYDGLGWFRLNALGAFCMRIEEEYQLQVPKLPPLLTAADELEFHLSRTPESHERMLLEQYANISNKQVRLDLALSLKSIEQGGKLTDLVKLLEQQTESGLPVEVEDFLDEIRMRVISIRDRGRARIIDCATESLAKLLVESGETGKYCFHADGKRVVVMEKSLRGFLGGLRKLGYVLNSE